MVNPEDMPTVPSRRETTVRALQEHIDHIEFNLSEEEDLRGEPLFLKSYFEA